MCGIFKCANCGKKQKGVENYRYGLDHGQAYCYSYCNDCAKTLTEEDHSILKQALVKQYQENANA